MRSLAALLLGLLLTGCAGAPTVLVLAAPPDDPRWRPDALGPRDSAVLADRLADRLRAGGLAAVVSGATLRPGAIVRGAAAPGEAALDAADRLEADLVFFAWIERVDRAPDTETTRAFGGLALFDSGGQLLAALPRASAAPDGPVGMASRAPLEDGDPRARHAVEALVARPFEPLADPWRRTARLHPTLVADE